ncbi:hypothetical protein, partial [Methylicorpusculum sp.]|uniref:hypothetical protein n=1 Tax=Methylicorpusculum sp. TaxID=2713644 RepID=UPI002ABC362B
PIIAKASTTCSYSLDPITLTSPFGESKLIKECLSGLSPDALCRNGAFVFSNNCSLLEFKQEV